LPESSVAAGIATAGHRRAILLLLAAMVCVACVDTIAKLLTAELPVIQIAWARFFFIFVCFGPFFVRTGASLVRSGNLRVQLFRAGLQVVSTFSFFTALKYMPVADVVAIAFAAPLFMIVLAGPMLGEQPGLHRCLAVLVGLGGVCVIVRPGFVTPNWGMALAILAAFSFALFQVLTRILARTDGSLTTLFYSTVVGAVLLTATVPTVWVAPSPMLWLLMAGLGLFGAIAHALMVEAFSTAPTSTLAPFTYVEIVWATLLGYLVFGDLPDRWVVVGAAIVVASGLYAFTREGRPRG